VSELVSHISVIYQTGKDIVSAGSKARAGQSVYIFGCAAGGYAELFATNFVKLHVFVQERFVNSFAHGTTAFPFFLMLFIYSTPFFVFLQ
jgi:hypothetical protein